MSNNNSSNKGPVAAAFSFLVLCLICAVAYWYFQAHSISGTEAGNILGQAVMSLGSFLSDLGKAIAGWLPAPKPQ